MACTEKWNARSDWRNAACAIVAVALYFTPWLFLQARWPIFVPVAEKRIPPVAVSLGVGLGGLLALVIFLAVAVPRLMKRMGFGDLAWRWQGGALHAAWIGLAMTAVHVGMRLPLPSGFQVIVTAAILVVGGCALRLLDQLAVTW